MKSNESERIPQESKDNKQKKGHFERWVKKMDNYQKHVNVNAC